MDTDAERNIQPAGTPPTDTAAQNRPAPRMISTNGAPSRAPSYLDELQALRSIQVPGGLRIFNSDAALAKLDERLRRALARLDSLDEMRSDTLVEDVDAYDDVLAALNRDPAFSVVPADFILHETDKLRDERVERARTVLAALRQGDPDEHRETLELLQEALDEAPASRRMQHPNA
jgi:hypothetical protein